MLKGDSSVGDDGISQALASEALPSLVLLLLLLSCNAAGASQSEASALLQWKSSLFRSEALHSWSLDSRSNCSNQQNFPSPCSWTGVACDVEGSVVEISLPNMGLQGKLDGLSLSSFPNLVHLNLSLNVLLGTIPDSIGFLSKLAFLGLSVNSLSGSLPTSLSNLTQLLELNMSSNAITGEINPIIFTNWTKLTTLALQQNQLIGKIPSEVSFLLGLRLLRLYENSLGGLLPP